MNPSTILILEEITASIAGVLSNTVPAAAIVKALLDIATKAQAAYTIEIGAPEDVNKVKPETAL